MDVQNQRGHWEALKGTRGALDVHLDDNSQLDAFGRLRTSNTTILLDAQHHYGQMHHLFIPLVTAGGTVVNDMAKSALILSVTSTVGSKAISRSRRTYYVAGQSHNIIMTGAFLSTPAGIRKRMGYYDEDDGFFIQNLSGTISLGFKSSVSGTVVETNIDRVNWSIDKLDGTGPSGINMDAAPYSWDNLAIYGFDMQWLGAGRVRFSINIEGIEVIFHEVYNASKNLSVYMQTPNLPCTYEIENISATVGSSMEQVCASITTEGSRPTSIIRKTASNAATPITCPLATHTHVLSIRPSTTFKSRPNKGVAVLLTIEAMVTGNNPAHIHIIEDAVLTTPTWVAHPDADSMMEYCVVASGFSGGTTRDEAYGTAGGKAGDTNNSDDGVFYLQIDPAGVPDSLTVVAEGIGGSADVSVILKWTELY